jgi:outer membrane biosynthesis protein TonB
VTTPEPPPEPSVSTAPAEGSGSSVVSPDTPLRRRRLPAHLGHARTSTVLLAAAFLVIGLLYLFVKPPAPSEAADPGTGSSSTSRPGDPAPQAPATTTPPPTTSDVPEPTDTTPSEATTSPSEPTEEPVETTPETTAPEEPTLPTSEPAPTTAAPTS